MRYLMAVLLAFPLYAQQPYDTGDPLLRDVWVDPQHGADTNDGVTRATALRTLAEAWERIPARETLTEGVRIQLVAGVHARDTIPHYFESRWGTREAPIVINSADGSRAARIGGDFNIFDTRYLYLVGLDMRPEPRGDVVHCEQCDHLLVRDCHLDGGAREAQETFKANQSQHVYIESSDIHGAYDNAVDFVAVQYGHVLHSDIHDAEDWCMYTKGGSAYFLIYGNEIYDCGTGGFSAGQGTGFQYMTPPWIHYEAYGIRAIDNDIHDTEGAALGVNGGYNILFAHNTATRVGTRSHLLEVVYGGRSCDGIPGEDPSRARCEQYLAMGGWGNTLVADGENYVRIPNRNVFIYNNTFINPPDVVSPQHLTVFGPYPQTTPVAAIADTNLQIRGNVFVNGAADHPLGIGDGSGCAATNPTCNEAQLRAENSFNAGTSAPEFALPTFDWSDAPPGVPAPETPAGRGRRRAAGH